MKYDVTDFLEHFDLQECIYEEEQWDRYTIALQRYNTQLEVTLMLVAESVRFTVGSVIDFKVHNIASIKCDKDRPNDIRFLFYKKGQENPFIIVQIKPFVSLIFTS